MTKKQNHIFVGLILILLLGVVGCSLHKDGASWKQLFFQENEKITKNNIQNFNYSVQWLIYDVNDIAWSADGLMFAIAGADRNNNYGVYAYQVDKSEPVWYQETFVPFSLSYSPDGKTIVLPYFMGPTILNADTGYVIREYSSRESCFGNVDIGFGLDGSQILFLSTILDTTNQSTEVNVWDTATDQCVGQITIGEGISFDFDISHVAQLVVLGLRDVKTDANYEQQVHLLNFNTQRIVCTVFGKNPVIDPSGELIAAIDTDDESQINLFDTKSCNLIGSLIRDEEILSKMDFNYNGNLLAVGGETLQIWHIDSGSLLFESDQFPKSIEQLVFSPDGKYLLTVIPRITGNDNATISLWGIEP